jgi:hypothetical protein
MELADDAGSDETQQPRGTALDAANPVAQIDTENEARLQLAHDCASSPIQDPSSYNPHTLCTELARRGKLSPGEVLAIASALTRGLVHLHGAGLVHRDIKPSNVIFVHNRARLADVGLVDREGHLSMAGTAGYVAQRERVLRQICTASAWSFTRWPQDMTGSNFHNCLPSG